MSYSRFFVCEKEQKSASLTLNALNVVYIQ